VDKRIKPLTLVALERFFKGMDVIPLEDGEEKPDVDKYSKFVMKKSS